MIDVKEITTLHKETVEQWHEQEIENRYSDFLSVVCQQHERNFRLWHQEDIARSRDVSDKELAEVKRRIDRLNQERNDFIERLDDCLIHELGQQQVVPEEGATLNTETPGSVMDRLSILSLRLFHMHEQENREDASDEHRQKVRDKLTVLYQQHADLSNSLQELLADIFAGRKQLKIYRQMKMYNDETMNPYLYNAKKKHPAA
ncbi:MAG: DUF4254 domain-containing protein [Planctomycetia bacterium]|jgi:hypothetical protein